MKKRYVFIKDSENFPYDPPTYEIGYKIDGERQPIFTVDDFVISQLDESYLDDGLFNAVAKLWKLGAPEDEVKKFYKDEYRKRSRNLYDRAYEQHVNMRKKKTTTKPKRKVCRCK